MIIKLPFLTFFFFLSIYLHGQSPTISKQQLIEGIAKYRTEMLRENAKGVVALGKMYRRLDSLGFTEEEFKATYIKSFLYGFSFSDKPYEAIRERVKAHDSNSGFHRQMKREDRRTVESSVDLIELINMDLVKNKLPFNIKRETRFYDELEFYGIENGMRIGEIGAGRGLMSVMLGIVYKDVEIFINELRPRLIKAINKQLENTQSIRPSNTLVVVKGHKYSCGLEGKELDKIILRKVLHHFSDEKEMLQSIHQSLKPGGELLIYEAVSDFNKKEATCNKIISKATLKTIMTNNGWELKTEERVGDVLLFKYIFPTGTE